MEETQKIAHRYLAEGETAQHLKELEIKILQEREGRKRGGLSMAYPNIDFFDLQMEDERELEEQEASQEEIDAIERAYAALQRGDAR